MLHNFLYLEIFSQRVSWSRTPDNYPVMQFVLQTKKVFRSLENASNETAV